MKNIKNKKIQVRDSDRESGQMRDEREREKRKRV